MKRNYVPDDRLDIRTPVLTFKQLSTKENRDQDDLQTITSATHAPSNASKIKLTLITSDTPLTTRKATEILAYYFKREFHYDFAGYTASERTNPRDRIFLLTQSRSAGEYAAIGAVAFRWREYTNAPHERSLAWVWIHPFLRRQGILSSYWPGFLQAYGTFPVEEPLSTAMRHFLEKHAPQTLERPQQHDE